MASSDPRTATEGQWEDLIDKVKDKADLVDVPTIQMTTTDPGEGAPLADGHFIAVYGGSTQVGTSDIANGAVTTAKFAQTAVNQAIKTADNLTPSADTTAAWRTLLPNNGYYLTWYNTGSRFTNQPASYGFLETIRHSNEIYQRWYTQSTGPKMYRAGNGNGWYGGASTAGTFRTEVYTGLSNSVNTTMISNNAVTSAKIDFSTFKMDAAQKASFSFTAPAKGTLIVIGFGSNMWGYGGGSIRLAWKKTAGTASTSVIASGVIQGGNTISRSYQTVVKSLMTSGQTLTCELQKIDGSNPGTTISDGDCFYFLLFLPFQ